SAPAARDAPGPRPARLGDWPARAPAAELVVEDDATPVGEPLERFQVVVWETRAPVQRQQRNAAHADVTPVDAPAGNLDVPFGHVMDTNAAVAPSGASRQANDAGVCVNSTSPARDRNAPCCPRRRPFRSRLFAGK